MQLKPIGVVESPVTEPVDEGWGGVVSVIRLRPDLAAGLRGLEGCSHALVLFFMDRADFDPAAHLVRRPRERRDMPELGIFAQRARHRPNPIGVTAVRVLAVEEGALRVRGLDAIDGTPVLDIKPYYPVFDRVDDATVPGFVDELMQGYF